MALAALDVSLHVVCTTLTFRGFLFESVFKDKRTPTPFVEVFPEDDGESARAALPDHIYMDAMGFGMGNCCLQVRWGD